MTETCDPSLPHPNYDDIERSINDAMSEPTLPFALAALNTATKALPHTSEKGREWIADGIGLVVRQLDTSTANEMMRSPEFIKFAVAYRDQFRSRLDVIKTGTTVPVRRPAASGADRQLKDLTDGA